MTARLQRKIAKIEMDVLFDHDEAYWQWKQKLKFLRSEASERKRQQNIDQQYDQEAFSEKLSPKFQEETDDEEPNSDHEGRRLDVADGEETLFADIFYPPKENGLDGVPANTSAHESTTVTTRDFGKWTGSNPRKTLEETCKARFGA